MKQRSVKAKRNSVRRIRRNKRSTKIKKRLNIRGIRGGGESCKRTKLNNNCFETKCVDYENGVFDSIVKSTECGDWIRHWDKEAESFYYFNSSSKEATWVKPDVFSSIVPIEQEQE